MLVAQTGLNMKKIVIALACFIAFISNAADFEKSCMSIDARVTGGSKVVCRYFGKTLNASFHRDAGNYVFANMYVQAPVANVESKDMMLKLAKGMDVEISPLFFEAMKDTKPGESIGLKYKDVYVIWRNAPEKGVVDYSGFSIFPDYKEIVPGSVRCRASTCIRERATKWLGQTYVENNKDTSTTAK
jgi:hypothetical protein